MYSVMNSLWLFVVLLAKRLNANKIHRDSQCIQSGEKCSFISLLPLYPFNKYKFLIKILCSSVKVILFIYITTVVCQGAWLPWKPCSWYSTRTNLFELNKSATEWRCLVWKIIMSELILINLCRSASGVQFFWRHSVLFILLVTLDRGYIQWRQCMRLGVMLSYLWQIWGLKQHILPVHEGQLSWSDHHHGDILSHALMQRLNENWKVRLIKQLMIFAATV